MKNIKMCSFLLFSCLSALLSAQGKEAPSSSVYRSNSGVSAKDLSYRNAAYIVKPAITMFLEGMRNEGTRPTTYSPVIRVSGSGFSKNGEIVAECLCRRKSNNSWVSEPRMVFKADQDGNVSSQLLAAISDDHAYCKGTVKDVATGKIVMNAWQRQ
jgi:hypothetical protein